MKGSLSIKFCMSKKSRRATAVAVQYDEDMRGHVLNGAHPGLDGFVRKKIVHAESNLSQ